MKRLMIALASATALLASPAMAQEKIKIGAAPYGLNAEFMQIWAAALQDHPAVKSGEVELTIFDGRYDALVQQDQFKTMVTQKYNAIIFAPIDVDAGAAAVQSAADAGIPVVGSNTRVNSDLLASYVGSDDTISGYMEAKTVLDKIGCKGNVVILEGPVGQSAQISRLEGNKKALAECPDVKILEDQTANWSRAEAQTLMENWLTAHPKQING
ncbi:sugar ABC transporter substrate-binding protein, partial [Mesorhizobium sp. M7A.T.Ca.TU.009.01.3.1]